MLVYYQGFGKGNPFLIQHYPASEAALRGQLDNRRYSRFAPHSARPGDKGSGKGHPGKPHKHKHHHKHHGHKHKGHHKHKHHGHKHKGHHKHHHHNSGGIGA